MSSNNKEYSRNTLEPYSEEWAIFYLRHCRRESEEIDIFWSRFPEVFDFTDKEILDFGSGVGTMGIYLTKMNPKHITGIEIEPEFAQFSKYNLEKNHSNLKDKISYLCKNIDELEDNFFDVIISKDVLEHVIDLETVINKLANKLKPNGQMILGWGPLWYSPFGDHGLSKKLIGFKMPWAHLVIPKSKLLAPTNKERLKLGKKPLNNIREYGLNMIPFESYKNLIYKLGFHVDYFNTNTTNKFRTINKMPVPNFLKNYWVRTIYCKLTKI